MQGLFQEALGLHRPYGYNSLKSSQLPAEAKGSLDLTKRNEAQRGEILYTSHPGQKWSGDVNIPQLDLTAQPVLFWTASQGLINRYCLLLTLLGPILLQGGGEGSFIA